jgi:hypothetical protein
MVSIGLRWRLGDARLHYFKIFLKGLPQPSLVQDDDIVPSGEPILDSLVSDVLKSENIG